MTSLSPLFYDLQEEAITTDNKKFCELLLEFDQVPYKYGTQSLISSDCSGSINYVLNLMYDTRLRLCADDFYRKIFTSTYVKDNDIAALFFIDRKTGRAVHVAGRAMGDFFVNVSSIEQGQMGHIRKRVELDAMYPSFDRVLRGFNRNEWLRLGGKI